MHSSLYTIVIYAYVSYVFFFLEISNIMVHGPVTKVTWKIIISLHSMKCANILSRASGDFECRLITMVTIVFSMLKFSF